MNTENKSQNSLEKLLDDFPPLEAGMSETLMVIFGRMEDWILELGSQRLFLNPATREWLFFDRIHNAWAPTGFGAGEVEFVEFGERLGVRTPKEEDLSAAETVLRRREMYMLEVDVPAFPSLVPIEGVLLIGRGKDCDIRLEDKLVSRNHARLVSDSGVITIEDLGTTNGTRVNDIDIDHPTQLQDGDRIMIGDIEMKITQKGS